MRRREFISLLGGAAVAAGRLPRGRSASKAARCGADGRAFIRRRQRPGGSRRARGCLAGAGLAAGGNIEISYRWPGAELDAVRAAASEIVASHPDLVVSRSTPATPALRARACRSRFLCWWAIRSVRGFVQTLARPGGNVTGFTNFEASVGGKWVELLKEAAPGISHVTLLVQSADRAVRRELSAAIRCRRSDANSCRTVAPVITASPELGNAVCGRGATPGGGIIAMFDTFLGETIVNLFRLAATLSLADDLRLSDSRRRAAV